MITGRTATKPDVLLTWFMSYVGSEISGIDIAWSKVLQKDCQE